MSVTNPNQTTTLAIRSLRTLEPRVMQAAGVGLARGLTLATSRAQLTYMQGPRPQHLGERTGRLIKSLVHEVKVNKDSVTGTIGSNLPYAAFHEFGFHGTVNVKAFTRVTSAVDEDGSEFDAYGNDYLDRKVIRDRAGVVVGRESRKKAASRNRKGFVAVGIQFVKAHTRNLNYAGKPYVAPALADTQPVIIGEIQKELNALNPENSQPSTS